MDIKELLKEIRENHQDAGLDTLENWLGKLSVEYAWLCENIGDCKRDRAMAEVKIKQDLIAGGQKPTETEVERTYYTTEQGQFLALNQEMVKAIGKMISFIRFRVEALRGKI